MKQLATENAPSQGTLRRNALWRLISWGFISAVNVANGVMVARVLGAEGKGAWALVMFTAHWVGELCSLGLQVAASYFVGRRGWSPRWVLRTNLLVSSVLWAATALVLGLLHREIHHWLDLSPTGAMALALVLIGLPIDIAGGHLVGILRAEEQITQVCIAETARHVAWLALTLAVLFAYRGGLVELSVVFLASHLIQAVVGWWYFARRSRPDTSQPPHAEQAMAPLVAYGFGNLLIRILAYSTARMDLLVVQHYVGPAGVGVYSVAMSGAELMGVAGGALPYVLLPRIASSGREQETRVGAAAHRVAVLQGLIMVIPLAPLGIVLPVVYGPSFSGAVVPFWICLGGLLLRPPSMVLDQLFIGGGRASIVTAYQLAGFGVMLGLDFVLVPRHGVSGAAVGYAVALLVQYVLALGAISRSGVAPLRELFSFRREEWRLFTLRRTKTNQERPDTTANLPASDLGAEPRAEREE